MSHKAELVRQAEPVLKHLRQAGYEIGGVNGAGDFMTFTLRSSGREIELGMTGLYVLAFEHGFGKEKE